MALNQVENQVQNKRVVVIVGGVGGVKLALGLQMILPPEQLTVIVNTGDDFWHYGLRVCPDIDTVLYTLGGRVDPVNGWGLTDDTHIVLGALREYGEEGWFGMGDKDIATHMLRTHLLREGHTLTQVIAYLAKQQGVRPTVLPMTNDPVATIVDTEEYGELGFQTYFVRYRWQPTVRGLRYEGAEEATLSPEVSQAIEQADMILFGPSNPWMSIAPIMAVPGMRDALLAHDVPRVAVTPIVGGQALKGPAAKLMAELGYEVSAAHVAEYYGPLITGFVYDKSDPHISLPGLSTIAFDTIMRVDADKERLAREIVHWVEGYNE